MLLKEGCGIRSIARILKISTNTVQKRILTVDGIHVTEVVEEGHGEVRFGKGVDLVSFRFVESVELRQI